MDSECRAVCDSRSRVRCHTFRNRIKSIAFVVTLLVLFVGSVVARSNQRNVYRPDKSSALTDSELKTAVRFLTSASSQILSNSAVRSPPLSRGFQPMIWSVVKSKTRLSANPSSKSIVKSDSAGFTSFSTRILHSPSSKASDSPVHSASSVAFTYDTSGFVPLLSPPFGHSKHFKSKLTSSAHSSDSTTSSFSSPISSSATTFSSVSPSSSSSAPLSAPSSSSGFSPSLPESLLSFDVNHNRNQRVDAKSSTEPSLSAASSQSSSTMTNNQPGKQSLDASQILSASASSDSYQSNDSGNGKASLRAYPIGQVTIPVDVPSGYSMSNSLDKPKVQIAHDVIADILHRLTSNPEAFNKLYVMGSTKVNTRCRKRNKSSDYDNRAFVPAIPIHHLAAFVHDRFKQTSYSKQMGTYEYHDNPYVNSYDNYKSLDVNFEQYLPPPLPVPPAKPKRKTASSSSSSHQPSPAYNQEPDGRQPSYDVQPYESQYHRNPIRFNYEMHNGGPGNTETPRIFYSNE